MKRLIIEPTLAFDEAAEWATDDERAIAGGFAPARAREYLAWRAVVRREIGRDAAIAYNAAGAPMLTNYPLHLSVSHCRERAADSRKPSDETGHPLDIRRRSDGSGRIAVAISDAPCAVDIEPVTRNFRRAMPRYLSPAEQQLSDNPLFPAIAWCAKETLFKYAASTTGRSLDLLCDLHIDRIQFPQSTSCS
ncbi:MAG: 4'-phosphopantetheinyl transferase superfamily protein, partial [Alistipes sp.]|nr:4'-phosphopantetheinyl transferase superfamily protein [Alistipes sp.]